MSKSLKRAKRAAKSKTKIVDKCSLQVFEYRGHWLMEVRSGRATVYLRGDDSVEFGLTADFEDRVKGYIDRYLAKTPASAKRLKKGV